jgi:molybdopterin molybdotransferase
MISVTEARHIIKSNIKPLAEREIPLAEAGGKILSEDIFAFCDIPSFPQSAMDGYAFRFEDWKENGKLLTGAIIQAGHPEKIRLSKGTAVRIFTGAAVPEGADTVVMQEKTRLDNNILHIEDDGLKPGANIRPPGSEIHKGQLALAAGSLLNPAAIGFLSGIGIDKVKVIPSPSISIIITGKELVTAGQPLSYGQVYESNGMILQTALRQAGFNDISITRSDDNLEELGRLIETSLKKMDLILITGGVSVGDFDFTLQAAANCGVEKWFHKLKQKPGKPLYLGAKEQKTVFGLPGNPASVLTCFYEYILPALGNLTGKNMELASQKLRLNKAYAKKGTLTHFLRGRADGDTVTVLEGQESYKMASFASANCLIVLDEHEREYQPGEIVEIHLLPA